MSIADKLMEIADKIPQVYNTGFQKGMETVDSKSILYYASLINNVFGGVAFPENYEAELRFKKAPQNCGYMFNNCRNLKSVKLISEQEQTAVDLQSAFNLANNGTATLEIVDFREFCRKIKSTFNLCFNNQYELKSILGALDLSAVTSAANAFYNCRSLTNIELVPETAFVNISFLQSPILSDYSIQSIIDGLATITDGVARTLTLHADVKAKLTEAQIGTITTTKGWTLA